MYYWFWSGDTGCILTPKPDCQASELSHSIVVHRRAGQHAETLLELSLYPWEYFAEPESISRSSEWKEEDLSGKSGE